MMGVNFMTGRPPQPYIIIFLILVILIGLVNWSINEYSGSHEPSSTRPFLPSNKIFRQTYYMPWEKGQKMLKINLATVACGDTEMLGVLIKSAILFSQHALLHMIIFSGREKLDQLNQEMMELQTTVKMEMGTVFTFEVNLIWFPNDPQIDWKNMRKTCTTQRLFFPSLLTHIDSLIYLDVDSILVGNLSTLWSEFSHMNQKQMIGAAPDAELLGTERYTEALELPYYGKNGLNAGVLLMNLTRLRQFDFERKIIDVYRQYTTKLNFADQDMINVLMYDNPDKVKPISCIHNFFYTFCKKPMASFCTAVKTDGIIVLHGAAGRFQDNGKLPFMHMCYDLMKQFQLNGSTASDLFMKMRDKFDLLKKQNGTCGYLTGKMLTKNALQYFENLIRVHH